MAGAVVAHNAAGSEASGRAQMTMVVASVGGTGERYIYVAGPNH